MEEELVNPFLVDIHRPLLLLEVLRLQLTLFGCILDELVNLLRMESVNNFPKEVSLWEPEVITSRRVWKVVRNMS